MKVTEKNDKFLWLGNSPALDFVNTEVVHDGKAFELLADAGDLRAWLVRSRLVDSVDTELPQKALRTARDFRQELRAGLEAMVQNRKAPDSMMASINALLLRHTVAFRLHTQGRLFELKTDWIFRAPEDVCVPIALSFARMLSTVDLGRVRRCKNPDCVLYFYDTSKSGTRSWCSLKICGDKLRMAAFRRKLADK